MDEQEKKQDRIKKNSKFIDLVPRDRKHNKGNNKTVGHNKSKGNKA